MSNVMENTPAKVAIASADIVKLCMSFAPTVKQSDAMSLFSGVLEIVSKLSGPMETARPEAETQSTVSETIGTLTDDRAWTPVMNPLDSISEDGNTIYCLVDGAPLKMLKRYIKRWGFTPDSYREAFGLPPDYPMTAPAYSSSKHEFALKIGLGTPENRAGVKMVRHGQVAA